MLDVKYLPTLLCHIEENCLIWKEDTFTDGQHRQLNEQIKLWLSVVQSDLDNQSILMLETLVIVVCTQAKLVDKALAIPDAKKVATTLQIPGFQDMFKEEIRSGDLRKTRSLRMFCKRPVYADIILSWEQPFERSSDAILKLAMQYWLSDLRHHYNAYVRCTTIVQSSGTRKSRMNDQLAKQVLYIPMVLTNWPDCVSLS
ncbi:uncharacterized protein PHACADRAFT_27980 [Phanerochaete carnosa HHB-10118-sp]|uniref:Uncharacterized protein n=1 Tax=Phanerochaete carnosa (strain HHB-10118-sp) TaxID=650164 RepID=K5V417_PHACS|nr:uncharacterized protein PHACADRAFT_27980 [Phanerochaete carnosa HHB-10118-sp]EKM57306.1 hypothetical protein PHACADRAFT_27980 [Phanerochaete carnosa HHB-10118-sp]